MLSFKFKFAGEISRRIDAFRCDQLGSPCASPQQQQLLRPAQQPPGVSGRALPAFPAPIGSVGADPQHFEPLGRESQADGDAPLQLQEVRVPQALLRVPGRGAILRG